VRRVHLPEKAYFGANFSYKKLFIEKLVMDKLVLGHFMSQKFSSIIFSTNILGVFPQFLA
jgi:hypothetical protein